MDEDELGDSQDKSSKEEISYYYSEIVQRPKTQVPPKRSKSASIHPRISVSEELAIINESKSISIVTKCNENEPEPIESVSYDNLLEPAVKYPIVRYHSEIQYDKGEFKSKDFPNYSNPLLAPDESKLTPDLPEDLNAVRTLQNIYNINKTKEPDSKPGPSNRKVSSTSFKTAHEVISEDLETIRKKIIGPDPLLTKLIIKQGLLMDSKMEALNKVQTQAIHFTSEYYQPPPPYYDPAVEGGGRITQSRQAQVPPRNPDLPPYSRYDRNMQLHNDEDELGFFNQKIRHKFIQKVYTILASQLSISLVGILVATFVEPVREFIQRDIFVYYIAMSFMLILLIMLACYQQIRRIYPLNFILLFSFTIAKTYLLMFLAATTQPYIILAAIGVTTLSVVTVSVFACQTKWDITSCGFMLALTLMVFMMFGLIATIVYMVTHSRLLYLILCGLGVVMMNWLYHHQRK
ncbi:uncharacterized protein LOC109605003 isoform X2 [Aethina tumida]|uniref:uncharacterized protein LOC109605003 isoform X2 n=1 Tax=Aethina tumida TaxID=116153 RepID=UPI00214974F8|nr:uncharacterized protein LOC109605003 isoform X2 [Aethina tumida]